MKKCIDTYIQNHSSNYLGKYKRLSSVKVQQNLYKFRYYTRDEQFREVHIFLSLTYSDGMIEHDFSVELNEQEKVFIIKDALQGIKGFLDHRTLLHADIFELYLKNNNPHQYLEPQDYRNILDYIEYHDGISEQTIDQFHFYFIPYIDSTIENQSYKNTLEALELYFDKILYEYIWDGSYSKYIDYQYHFHMKYINDLMHRVSANINEFYECDKITTVKIFKKLFTYPRFLLMYLNKCNLPASLKLDLIQCISKDLDLFEDVDILIVNYFKSHFSLNTENQKKYAVDILNRIVIDYYTFDNVDMQLEIGNCIIDEYSYDIVIQLFLSNYNSYIFNCFPINKLSIDFKLQIKQALENACYYYNEKMDNPSNLLSSIEQICNVNRLLLNIEKGV